jgi:DNA-binding Lrp family transcriptional regulator
MFTKHNNVKNTKTKLFILVNCLEGKDDSVLNKIKKINSVIDVQKTVGVYDLIVTLEDSSIDNLKKTALQKIRTVDCIKYTMTLSTT